jgi:hypothetical protein
MVNTVGTKVRIQRNKPFHAVKYERRVNVVSSIVDCKVTYVNDLRVVVLHAFKGTSLFMLLSMKGNLSLVRYVAMFTTIGVVKIESTCVAMFTTIGVDMFRVTVLHLSLITYFNDLTVTMHAVDYFLSLVLLVKVIQRKLK